MAISRHFRSDHHGPLVAPPGFARTVSTLQGDALDAAFERATLELLELQRDAWISIATDGDLRAQFIPSAPSQVVDDARFLAQHAQILTKVSLRRASAAAPGEAGALTTRDTLLALIDLGVSYVQLDGSAYAPLLRNAERAALAARGIDADAQLARLLERDAALLAALPIDDAHPVKLALCFHDLAQAAPAPFAHDLNANAAQRVLHGLPVDRFLFDCARDGTRDAASDPADFEFLRLLPAHTEATLGLIDARAATLPTSSDLVAHIDAAAQIIDTDRLALSASQPLAPALAQVHANDPETAWEHQRALLTLLLDASSEAWGIDF